MRLAAYSAGLDELRRFRDTGKGDARSNILSKLCSGLIADALAIGVHQMEVCTSLEAWTIVGSDEDWITPGVPEGKRLVDAFQSINPHPRLGSGAIWHMVHIGAAARDIFVISQGQTTVIAGEPPPANVLNAASWKYSLGFRLSRANEFD